MLLSFPGLAISLVPMGAVALVEAAIFVAVLALGLAYVWRKGDVDWTPFHGHSKPQGRVIDEIVEQQLAEAESGVGAGA